MGQISERTRQLFTHDACGRLSLLSPGYYVLWPLDWHCNLLPTREPLQITSSAFFPLISRRQIDKFTQFFFCPNSVGFMLYGRFWFCQFSKIYCSRFVLLLFLQRPFWISEELRKVLFHFFLYNLTDFPISYLEFVWAQWNIPSMIIQQV